MMVIGLGNSLRGDDGLGPELVSRMKKSATVHSEHFTGDGLLLAEYLVDLWSQNEAVVLVDAVQGNEAAVTFIQIDLNEQPWPSHQHPASSHGFGIVEGVELARNLGQLPKFLHFFGVVGQQFELGASMSDAVEGSLPHLLRAIEEKIAEVMDHA